ncbi:MAG: universal stress protein, partial [Terriglobales bacterium]
AHSYDAEVYAVNVLPHLPFVEAVQPDPEQTRLLAEQKLAALVGSESFKGIRHKELIKEGEVAEVLSKLVSNYEIDLIVIGTGGRKGLGKLLLGSVAEEVFRNAECPVLTVGPNASRWLANGNLRHILYATDFGPESLHGLPYAISLAEENRARLTLLHVAPEPGVALPEPEPGTMPVLDPSEVVAAAERQLRALVPYRKPALACARVHGTIWFPGGDDRENCCRERRCDRIRGKTASCLDQTSGRRCCV